MDDDADDPDALIWHLHREERLSTRQIAKRVSRPRTTVQRIIARLRAESRAVEAAEDDDDLDALERKLLAASISPYVPVLPYTYEGMRRVRSEHRTGNEPRIIDATGRQVNAMARNRYFNQVRDSGDPEALRRLRENMAAIDTQIRAEGWRWISVGGGHRDYRQVEEIERDNLRPPWQDLLDYDGIGPPPMSRPIEELLAEWDRENGIVRR